MLTVMAMIRTAADLREGTVRDALSGPAMAHQAGGITLGRVFNRVSDRTQKGISYARGGFEMDAIAQFFFADVSSSLTAAQDGGMDLTMGLPPGLIDEVQPILCLQNTVIAPPPDGSALKRMSILRKRPEVSPEFFQDQWFNMHSILLKRMPGIMGYRQNLVIDGPRDENGHMLVDGMVELWFPDGDTIDAAFQSDIGTTTMTHAREFIAEISTFLVEPTVISGVS